MPGTASLPSYSQILLDTILATQLYPVFTGGSGDLLQPASMVNDVPPPTLQNVLAHSSSPYVSIPEPKYNLVM